MNTLVTILCFINLFVAIILAWDFYVSRNGILRKIMIGYFVVESYLWTVVISYFLSGEASQFLQSLWFLIFVILKSVIKIRFWYYQRYKR